jgi:ferric-dicitrate binding protein FerR (iron transport regulator)
LQGPDVLPVRLQVPCSNNNAPYSLRQIYQKYLLPYEEQMSKKAREHQEEVERRRAAEHKEALEAAEILEAMLGMSAAAYGSEDAERDPAAARKRKRGKVRPAAVPGQLLRLLLGPLPCDPTPPAAAAGPAVRHQPRARL